MAVHAFPGIRTISSVARGVGDLAPPQLACRPKCRIRKLPRFSTSKTVFCTGIDLKNDLKHILNVYLEEGLICQLNKTHKSE